VTVVLFEFCITVVPTENARKEETFSVGWHANNEHDARRQIVCSMLNAGYWVSLLLSVEDLTGEK